MAAGLALGAAVVEAVAAGAAAFSSFFPKIAFLMLLKIPMVFLPESRPDIRLCQINFRSACKFLQTRLHLEPASGYRRYMATDTVLSILVLAAIALLVGAFVLWRRGGTKRQVVLMVILAFVAIGNVAIWIIPDSQGNAPLNQKLSE
jgi:hypothetical protein